MTATVIEQLVVTLGLDGSAYRTGGDDVRRQNKKLRDDAGQTAKDLSEAGKRGGEFFGEIAKKALGFFAVISAGRGFEQLYTQAVQVGAATGRMAQNIGTSTARLSAWQNVMKQAGQSADDATASMQNLAQQQVALQTGNPMAAQGLRLMQQYAHVNAFAGGKPVDPADLLMPLANYFHGLSGPMAQLRGQQFGLMPGMITALQQTPIAQLKQWLGQDSTVDQQQAKILQQEIAAMSGLQISIDKLATAVAVLAAPAVIADIDTLAAGFNTMAQMFAGTQSAPDAAALGAQSFENYLNNKLYGDPLSLHQNPSSGDTVEHRRQQMMNYFIGKGLTPMQAAGPVGNAMYETGGTLDPQSINPQNGAYGAFQWLGSRRKALFAKYGPNPTLQQQMDFAWSELTTDPTYMPTLNALRGTSTASDAADAWNSGFERSGDTGTKLARRRAFAQAALASSWDVSMTAAPGTSGGPIYQGAPSGLSGSVETYITRLRNAQIYRSRATQFGMIPQKTSMTVGDIIIHTGANTSTGIARDAGKKIRQQLVTQGNSGIN